MKPLVITGAPGTVTSYTGQRNNPRRVDDAGGTPTRQKTVHLLLDVTDARFRQPLLAIFPGSDFLIKAMAEDPKCPAAVLTMAKKLADVSVLITAVDGDDVFPAQVCKVSGKPTLRIDAGAKKVEMPVVIRATLNRDIIRRIDDMLGADAVINVQTAQSDVEDALPDGEGQAPKPKKKKADKVSVPIVDEPKAA